MANGGSQIAIPIGLRAPGFIVLVLLVVALSAMVLGDVRGERHGGPGGGPGGQSVPAGINPGGRA